MTLRAVAIISIASLLYFNCHQYKKVACRHRLNWLVGMLHLKSSKQPLNPIMNNRIRCCNPSHLRWLRFWSHYRPIHTYGLQDVNKLELQQEWNPLWTPTSKWLLTSKVLPIWWVCTMKSEVWSSDSLFIVLPSLDRYKEIRSLQTAVEELVADIWQYCFHSVLLPFNVASIQLRRAQSEQLVIHFQTTLNSKLSAKLCCPNIEPELGCTESKLDHPSIWDLILHMYAFVLISNICAIRVYCS